MSDLLMQESDAIFSDPGFDSDFGADVLLPVASESQNIAADYRSTGLPFGAIRSRCSDRT